MMMAIVQPRVTAAAIAMAIVGGTASGAAPNLAVNPGFESAGGWTLTIENGATGTAAPDAAKVKTGAAAMKLTKTNSRGLLRLTSAAAIRVEPNVLYTFRGWFHSEDAPVSALLLFRVGAKDGPLHYDAIDLSAGWMSQSLLINSPPGRWEKRVVTYQSPETREVYLNVVLSGNPSTVCLDDLEFTAEPYRPSAKPGAPRSPPPSTGWLRPPASWP
jgi:hypothetical protein